MPFQTPSASDYTNTVKGAAEASAAVANTSAGIFRKPSGNAVVSTPGALRGATSLVTNSSVARSSGLQPFGFRTFPLLQVIIPAKTWVFTVVSGLPSGAGTVQRVLSGGSTGAYMACITLNAGNYSLFTSMNGGTNWTNRGLAYQNYTLLGPVMSKDGTRVFVCMKGGSSVWFRTTGTTANVDNHYIGLASPVSSVGISADGLALFIGGGESGSADGVRRTRSATGNYNTYAVTANAGLGVHYSIAPSEDGTKVYCDGNIHTYSGSTSSSQSVSNPTGTDVSWRDPNFLAGNGDLSILARAENSTYNNNALFVKKGTGNWVQVLPKMRWNSLEMSSDGSIIVASAGTGTGHTSSATGLFVSNNEGTSFETFYPSTSFSYAHLNRANNVIYATTQSGAVYRGVYM